MTELIAMPLIMIEIRDLPEYIHIGFLLGFLSHLFYFLFMLTFKFFKKEHSYDINYNKNKKRGDMFLCASSGEATTIICYWVSSKVGYASSVQD